MQRRKIGHETDHACRYRRPLGGQTVLHDVDFHIGRGEIVTIVGPNGSGKSTLLRVIIGAELPAAGRVGAAKTGCASAMCRKCCMSTGGAAPGPCAGFLDLPARMPEALATVGARAGGRGARWGNRQMADLSGGQFQRVLLARVVLF